MRLSSFYFWYYALLGMTHPFWPIFLAHQQFNAREIGLLLAVQMGTRIVSPNLWGWLADRSGNRLATIRLGAFLGLISFSGIYFVSGFWDMLFVIAAYSFFWNAVMPQFEALTLDYIAKQPANYSKIRLWGSVGFILAVTVGGFWFERSLDDFRLAGLLVLAMIWVSTLYIRSPKKPNHPAHSQTFFQVLTVSPVLAFLMASFLLQVSHGIYYTFFSLHLEAAGYPRSQVGMFWALSVLAEIVLFLVMHRLMTTWALREIFVFSLVLTALRWVLIAFFETSLVCMIVAQCLHALSFGACHAIAIEYLRRFFSGPHRGRGQAIYTSVSFGAGGAIGALIGGFFWDYSPAATFCIGSVLSLIAAFVVWIWLDHRRYPDEKIRILLCE